MAKPKSYIVYDGRAAMDIDMAQVVDVITAKSDAQARVQFNKMYSEYDYVLVDPKGAIIGD